MNPIAWRLPADFLGETTLHVAVGDLVRTGDNSHPHYHVIAVTEDRAWIRDAQHGTDHIVPIDRCQRIEDADGGGAHAHRLRLRPNVRAALATEGLE